MSGSGSSSLYRFAAIHLMQLGDMAADAGAWRKPTSPESVHPVFLHVSLLVAVILSADGMLASEEHDFLNALYGTDNSYDDNFEYVKAMMDGSRENLLRKPPEFFDGLIRLDRVRRTQSSIRALQLLHLIAIGAMSADDDMDDREFAFFRSYIDMLGNSVVRSGVASETQVAAVSVEVPDFEDLINSTEAAWGRPIRPRSTNSSSTEEAVAAASATTDHVEGNGSEATATASEGKDLTSLMAELTALVGLEPVKQEVVSMTNQIRVRQMRIARGLSVPPTSNHIVFYGSPGTGKTTVARILAGIYRELGVLPKGHLVETDRSGMVAAYVGQTAIKVQEIVQKAMGGVLFIDEAYALVSSRGEQDYGREAVDVLLKLMEDHRDDLVVIVAGYDDKMAEFLEANPGLKSRFNKFIRFPDYSADDLMEIFRRMVTRNEYVLSPEAEAKIVELLTDIYVHRDTNFGNARLARNLFEQILAHQADRIAQEESLTDEALSLILPADVPSAPVLH